MTTPTYTSTRTTSARRAFRVATSALVAVSCLVVVLGSLVAVMFELESAAADVQFLVTLFSVAAAGVAVAGLAVRTAFRA